LAKFGAKSTRAYRALMLTARWLEMKGDYGGRYGRAKEQLV